MTSPPEVLPHADAVQAAIAAQGVTVYLAGAPAGAPDKYAVVYPDPGQTVRESLADARTDFTAVVQVTCVGATAEKALWVTGRVRRALAVPLTVDGRACWRPEDLGGPPLARDDDVTPPVFFLPVEYRLQSTSA